MLKKNNDEEIVEMLKKTSNLIAEKQACKLSSAAIAWGTSDAAVENIEFWKWMNRNYSGANGHMFASNTAMQDYIAQGQGKADWMYKQLQGKGYEWDWMSNQRKNIKNAFRQYSAGDVSNQPGYDVLEKDLISGKEKLYQMKAYTSKKNPDLHNTDKNIKVVTNSEKAETVQNNGYEVETFKNREQILSDTDNRMKQIHDGYATPEYNLRNVSTAMVKAGAMACMIGISVETVSLYRNWEQGEISDEQYLKEILKTGGDSGITAGVSAGIMMPVSAYITASGISSVVTIPIAFVVSSAINEVIAPCFGHGKYQQILRRTTYYQRIEECYGDFIKAASYASSEYIEFIHKYQNQEKTFQQMNKKNMEVNKQLRNIYDSI